MNNLSLNILVFCLLGLVELVSESQAGLFSCLCGGKTIDDVPYGSGTTPRPDLPDNLRQLAELEFRRKPSIERITPRQDLPNVPENLSQLAEQALKGRPSADRIRPRKSVDSIRPKTSIDVIRPRTSVDSIRPRKSVDGRLNKLASKRRPSVDKIRSRTDVPDDLNHLAQLNDHLTSTAAEKATLSQDLSLSD